MKALVKCAPGAGNLRVMEMPEPTPACGQVKIKVAAASICIADVGYYWKAEDTLQRLKTPVILGHEGSGVVVEVGPGVTHLRPGDRVTAETTLHTCKECDACRNGLYNDCKHRRGLGSSADGFFAEYVIAADASIHKIPDWLSFEAAAVLEPLACVTHGIFGQPGWGGISPYHEVLITGPGPIGLFAAQVAKLCGATVILSGTSRGMERLRLAQRFGVDHIINSTEENVEARVMELTQGRGVDIALECSGTVPAMENCFASLKHSGLYIWLAPHHHGVEYNLPLTDFFIRRQLRVAGARSSTPAAWDKALRLVRQGKIHAQELVSCILPLEDWERGFQMVEDREAIKVILDPNL